MNADRAAPIVLFLPARNEEASVGVVVRRTPAEVLGHPVRCVVVDDGSTDGTAALASEAGADVVTIDDGTTGLGAAVRWGLRTALATDPAAVAFCDADGEYAPEELAALVGPILAGDADYVVGSRFAGGRRRMRAHRWFGNHVLTAGLALVTRCRITDGQSGYRALSPAAAAAAEIGHDYNYAQLLTIDLLAKGARYTEVPISYAFRPEGQSFVRLVPYLRRVVPAVWRQLRAHNSSGLRPEPIVARLAGARSVDLPDSLSVAGQSSTTWRRNRSLADAQAWWSNDPPAPMASAASQPIASA